MRLLIWLLGTICLCFGLPGFLIGADILVAGRPVMDGLPFVALGGIGLIAYYFVDKYEREKW